MIWLIAISCGLIGFLVGVVFVEYFVEDFERDADGQPAEVPRGKLIEGRKVFEVAVLGALTAVIVAWAWSR